MYLPLETMTEPLTRKKNSDYRSREYLTFEEVKRLIQASELRGRHPLRDQALLLLMFRHGLRASEAAALKWDAVMLDNKSIFIQRLKGSDSGNHPLQADEMSALQALRNRYPEGHYLFANERGAHLTAGAISKIVERCGELAELPMSTHPHMLRHSCGFYLAEKGWTTRDIQAWLGHRNIQNTVGYTAMNPARFNQYAWELVL
jgi:integrase